MTPKRQRLTLVLAAVFSVSFALFIIAKTFRDNLVFFRTPSEIYAKTIAPETLVRIGGLVEKGSIKKEDGKIFFSVTDLKKSLTVEYSGALPDLFREGQGVVTEGYYRDGVFQATEVLAKHDEKYMPPEVARALKKSGRWHEGEAK
jgi:cytochrome c-type biogenesis protein CcmE